MSRITADQIVQAAREAVEDPNYRQSQWAPPETDCNTACCVLGRARLIAGLPQIKKGPQSGELPGGEHGQLGRLLRCPAGGVAQLLARARIDEAGRLDLTGADLREAKLAGADLREADLAGADLSGAYL